MNVAHFALRIDKIIVYGNVVNCCAYGNTDCSLYGNQELHPLLHLNFLYDYSDSVH